MTAFDEALEFTLKWEGGYSNHPDDPGGETYRGITRRVHPDWPGWWVVDRLKPKQGEVIDDPKLEANLAEFYRKHYWEPAGCHVIEESAPKTAAAVFDMAVHSGPAQAVRILQREIGAQEDGNFGPRSQFAFLDHIDQFCARGHVEERLTFLEGLIARKPKLRVFAEGWRNRAEALVKFVQRG